MTPNDRRSGSHLATLAHEGRIWDAYLEFEQDPHTYRARLRFDTADGEGPYQTTVLIIEDSYEAAVERAKSFDERQLSGLLRSVLPEPEGEAEAESQ